MTRILRPQGSYTGFMGGLRTAVLIFLLLMEFNKFEDVR